MQTLVQDPVEPGAEGTAGFGVPGCAAAAVVAAAATAAVASAAAPEENLIQNVCLTNRNNKFCSSN